MSVTRLSPHFTLEELTHSDTALRLGIDNTPPQQQMENLRLLCRHILEPLRERVNAPLRICSGYRSAALNRAVGGSATSAHLRGLAADIVVAGLKPGDVLAALKNGVIFDQAIIEYDAWLHVSFNPGRTNRRQCLRARRVDGRTRYEICRSNGG